MSSELEVFPYAFGEGAIALSCRPGDDRFPPVDGGARLDLTQWSGADALDLILRVEFDAGLAERLVPPSERSDPPLLVVVRASSIEGRSRGLVAAAPISDGSLVKRIELHHEDARGVVTLEPLVVRKLDASAHAAIGFAAHPGAIVARGAAISLDIDRTPSAGSTLDVRYTSFSASDDELFTKYAKDPFLVDLRDELPVVFLNQDVERLREIMDSEAATGHARRVRDAIFSMVVLHGWSALAGASLTALAEVTAASDPGNETEPFDELLDWQQGALRFLAPKMYGLGVEEALDRLVGELASPAGGSDVATRMAAAIQSHASNLASYTGLLQLKGG